MALREIIKQIHITHIAGRNAFNTTERIVVAMLSLYSKAYHKGT